MLQVAIISSDKGPIFHSIQEFHTLVMKHYGRTLQAASLDHGGEFLLMEFSKLLEEQNAP